MAARFQSAPPVHLRIKWRVWLPVQQFLQDTVMSMQNAVEGAGGEVSRPLRIFQREWKRNKPHLPKSTSLPILQLTPKDRPIFTCCRCGFVNTLIPLCLWCCWTSDAAHKKFELSMPRIRRASAPPRFFWQQKCHPMSTSKWRGSFITITSAQTTSPGIKRVSTDNTNTESVEIVPYEHSPDQSRNQQQNTQGDEWRCRRTSNLAFEVDHPPLHHDACYETPSETVTNFQDKVATATSSTLTFFDKPRIARRRSDESVLYDWAAAGVSSSHHNRRSTPMPLGTPSTRPSNKGVDRPTTMHAIKKLSTKSLRSAQLVIDLKNLHESYDVLKPDSRNQTRTPKSPTDPPPAQKTLRRKKRMTLFRTSTPPSATSVPDSASSITSQSPEHLLHALPVPSKQTHTRSQSQPHASVRLGHPSRPYYTAIRPYMSRPSSPVESVDLLHLPSSSPSRPLSLPPPPRAPSPGIFSVLSTTSFLSMPEREPLPHFSSSTTPSLAYNPSQRPFAFGSSMSHRSGFSLSGETELRMALAREQEEFGLPSQDRYRYRDMEQTSHTTGVMKKVNRLKRGLKDLVSRKA